MFHPTLYLPLSSISMQKQSQVALGGQGMRRELLGPEELYTSEDQVSRVFGSKEWGFLGGVVIDIAMKYIILEYERENYKY